MTHSPDDIKQDYARPETCNEPSSSPETWVNSSCRMVRIGIRWEPPTRQEVWTENELS